MLQVALHLLHPTTTSIWQPVHGQHTSGGRFFCWVISRSTASQGSLSSLSMLLQMARKLLTGTPHTCGAAHGCQHTGALPRSLV